MSANTRVVRNATCTFCGCVCDDMHLTVDDDTHKIVKAENVENGIVGRVGTFHDHRGAAGVRLEASNFALVKCQDLQRRIFDRSAVAEDACEYPSILRIGEFLPTPSPPRCRSRGVRRNARAARAGPCRFTMKPCGLPRSY